MYIFSNILKRGLRPGRRVAIVVMLLMVSIAGAMAQPPNQKDFLSFQKSFKRVGQAFVGKEQQLQQEFEAKGLSWPAKYMYIRSFKYDSQLEVWVKSEKNQNYKLFKRYKVCALAGSLGPKRLEGDYQVPEGFYYVNEFRPNSNYHLALGVNYPNPSDRILGDPARPGGDIYVHGSCVTVGCIPLTDPMIEELYVLAATTKNAGQDYIPIHVMPIMFKNEKSHEVLDKYLVANPDYEPMAKLMEKVYYYFNTNKALPTIMINGKGEYMMAQEFTPVKKVVPVKYKENTAKRKAASKMVSYQPGDFYAYVNTQPQFPGGLSNFQKFIDELAVELSEFIPEGGAKRLFIDVDFVIDAKGNVVNVVPGARANNEMNNLIIERFEAMPQWGPATRQDKAVPMRLVQNIVVEAKPEAPKANTKEDDDD
ncbi:MAG TPA: L,D-transpeptidase family protein [Phnomibacter sp.]|nr:L,D-transpeptidase family protein [Phnomibacter sp.]